MNSIDEKIRNERDVKELIDLAGNAVARMRTGAAKTSLTERYLDLVVRRAAEDSGQVV